MINICNIEKTNAEIPCIVPLKISEHATSSILGEKSSVTKDISSDVIFKSKENNNLIVSSVDHSNELKSSTII